MTTLTTQRARGGWRGFGRLLGTETRVWTRDFSSIFFGVLFPSVVLVGVGFAIPGMRDPIEDVPDTSPLFGAPVISVFMPTVLALAVGTLAIMSLPVTFATFRDKGVLRRFSTTPMRPQGIVAAHLIINVATSLVGVGLALVAAELAFGLVAPAQPAVVLAAGLLALGALFGLGMVLAAVVNKPSTANAVSSLIYFPMLFFAGLWTPGPIMPDIVKQIGQFTPMGAAAQAMEEGWFGDGIPLLQLAVMAGWTVVCIPVAVRLFRWT